MHQCPQCNELVSDERRYCSLCGAAQPVPHKPVQCEACGLELPAAMRFCKWCGAVQMKHDGGRDPAATTALGSEGIARPTVENLEAPVPADVTTQLQTNATTSVLREPRDYGEKAATTGELAPLSGGIEASEETLVRPSRIAANYAGDTLTTPNFTATLAPAISVAATKKKRNVLPLLGVGFVALALGTVLAFLLFQHFYRTPPREANAALPVVPVPLPSVGVRAAAPTANTAALPTQIISAPVPTPSIMPNDGSINAQPTPDTAVVPQPVAPNNAPVATVRLPEGAPRKGTGEWSGTVIGSAAIIEFSGRNQSVVGSAPSLRSAHLSLDNGLPQAPTTVRVDKKKGRGQINVIQQPSATNNYTARVQITNGKDAAPENYVFDFTWEVAAP
jgi:hypothetical protein